jgi:hypothetical protein
MRGISRLAEELLASQEGLCSMELSGWLFGLSVSQSVNYVVSYLVSQSVR